NIGCADDERQLQTIYIPVVNEVPLHIERAQHSFCHIDSPQQKAILNVEKELSRLRRVVDGQKISVPIINSGDAIDGCVSHRIRNLDWTKYSHRDNRLS